MKTWFGVATVACAMTVGAVSVGHSQEPAAPTSAPGARPAEKAARPASADSTFMKTAAMDGRAEVEHGQLAAQNAASSAVKQFGQRMVDDHRKADAELTSLAAQKNVALPAELDAKHKATHDKLSRLTGSAFDSAYMAHMVSAHKDAVALFQREATSGTDADAKAFAEKTLPTLQEHLKLAQELSAKHKTN